MTESDWQACTDPTLLLQALRDRVSERQLRLFAAACCRHIWHLIPDEQGRACVRAAERFADGLTGEDELLAAASALTLPPRSGQTSASHATAAVWYTGRLAADEGAGWSGLVAPEVWNAIRAAEEAQDARAAAAEARHLGAGGPLAQASAAHVQSWHGERTEQCDLLREITGNPYRPTPSDAGSLAWDDGTVRRLARAIYEEGRFGELGILGDALDEAGCADPVILSHCRRPGGHVRGCWVLDLFHPHCR